MMGMWPPEDGSDDDGWVAGGSDGGEKVRLPKSKFKSSKRRRSENYYVILIGPFIGTAVKLKRRCGVRGGTDI